MERDVATRSDELKSSANVCGQMCFICVHEIQCNAITNEMCSGIDTYSELHENGFPVIN